MLIGPIVEGESEERAVPVLLKKLGVRHRSPLVAEGKQDLIRRARDYADLQRSKGASHVLFCFDADGPDGDSELRRLKETLTDVPLLGFVPVHALEAWLLADEEALTQHLHLSTPLTAIARPEDDPTPADTLDDLFRANGRPEGYRKTRDAHLIAKLARLQRLMRCASYARASESVRPEG